MKKKIHEKLISVENAMQRLENQDRFCYLKNEWMILHAQRQVWAEVLLMFPSEKTEQ